jgi:uncharacterized membrane protein YbhN (UPF0104 family)
MSVQSSTKRSPKLFTIARWVGTILTTALFIWLVSGQKWEVVLQKATGIPLWSIALAVVLYIASYGFNTLRWCCLLWAQDVEITYLQAFHMAWAGVFASNILPSTIGGDGLRMVGILRYTKSKTIAIGSVALDRFTNVFAMVCLLPVSLFVLGGYLVAPHSAKTVGEMAMLTISARLRGLFEHYFPKVANAFRAWASRPWAFVYAFLAAWPSNILPMTATYLLSRQVGMNLSFWQIIGVQTAAYFVSQLPSINGYGLREATYTTLYTALGASIEQASTLALMTRFLSIIATLPGAFWLSSSVTDAALNDADLNDETETGQS